MDDWTAELRTKIVLLVVRAIVVLTFCLYVMVGLLLLTHQSAPDALWLAAGNASGALFALLVNSKGTGDPAPPPRSITPRKAP